MLMAVQPMTGGCMQALDTIPRERAEWVLWIDMDIILGDITFTFPLDKVNYTDRDIITWGGKRAILAGDAYNGQLPMHAPHMMCFSN